MNQHIVIEGPSGAGKTTLAKVIAESSGLPYYHHGPTPDYISSHLDYWEDLFECSKGGVHDRAHWGELVYGHLLRDGSKLEYDEWQFLNQLVRESGGHIIVLTQSLLSAFANPNLEKGITPEINMQATLEFGNLYRSIPRSSRDGILLLQKGVEYVH